MVGLVGVAIQEIGYHELWPCVNHLTAPLAREALRRVTRIAPRADVLQDEMYWAYAGTKTALSVHDTNASQRRLDHADGIAYPQIKR